MPAGPVTTTASPPIRDALAEADALRCRVQKALAPREKDQSGKKVRANQKGPGLGPVPGPEATAAKNQAIPLNKDQQPSYTKREGANRGESTPQAQREGVEGEAERPSRMVPTYPHEGEKERGDEEGDSASSADEKGFEATARAIRERVGEEKAPDGWADPPNALRRLDDLILEAATIERIFEILPGLEEPAHWGLALWSVFGERIHTSTDRSGRTYQRVMIWTKLLAHLENETDRLASKKYVARRFLEAHREILPGFEYTGWKPGAYTRQVRRHGLPEKAVDLIRRDLLTPIENMERPVRALSRTPLPDRSTGEAARRRKNRREMRRTAALHATRERATCDLQRRLLRYLNTRGSRLFARRFGRNVERTMEATLALEEESTSIEERLRALKTLQAVQLRPQVFYQPSRRGRTARVFPKGESILGLPSEVRSALMAGGLECDLANAQLAIAAKEWNIEPLEHHLTEGDWLTGSTKIWPLVFRQVGYLVYEGVATEYTQHDAVKKALKRAIYAIVFGMERAGVRWMLWQSFRPTQVKSLLRSLTIEAIFEARTRVMAEVDAQGYAEDCFGTRYELTAPRDCKERKEQVRSALASVMQAWELKLLEPIVEDAIRETEKKSGPAYQILAWQHDGFTLAVSKNKESIERRMKRFVQRQADRLGIPTFLETEWLS